MYRSALDQGLLAASILPALCSYVYCSLSRSNPKSYFGEGHFQGAGYPCRCTSLCWIWTQVILTGSTAAAVFIQKSPSNPVFDDASPDMRQPWVPHFHQFLFNFSKRYNRYQAGLASFFQRMPAMFLNFPQQFP